MNKETILTQIILLAILVSVVIFLVTSYETLQEKTEIKGIEKKVLEETSSLLMDNVYATGDCSEIIQKIKDERMSNLNKTKYRENGEMSWFAAGLALGVYYVGQDCDNASEKMDELLDETWNVSDDYGQSDKLDDLSAAFRFIKNLL